VVKRLNKAFKIGWKRPPAHTAIRYILQGLNPADVEKVFREHAADLNSSKAATTLGVEKNQNAPGASHDRYCEDRAFRIGRFGGGIEHIPDAGDISAPDGAK
jgi:hypothetical protein